MTNKIPPFVILVEPETLHRIIAIRQGEDCCYTIETVSGITFDRPSKAYDYITRVLKGTAVFDTKELETHGEGNEGFFFEKDTNRMIFSYTQEEKLKSLEYHYKYFLETTAKDYFANPEDWCEAYMFVENHPAFWHRTPNSPDNWLTDKGWEHAWISIYKEYPKDGKPHPVVLIEHGPYLTEEFKDGSTLTNSIPCHDPDLDVFAQDYHTAIVEFAKTVAEHFNLDGSEKPRKK